MTVQCDDDLYRVDRVYLGPKGKPWPFRMTYRGYVLWALLVIVGVVIWRTFHLPWGVLPLLCVAAAAFFGAQWLDKHLTADRPLGSEVSRIWQELTAPRPDLTPGPQTVALSVSVERWRPSAAPAPRHLAQAATAIMHTSSHVAAKVTGTNRGRVFVNGGWQDVR